MELKMVQNGFFLFFVLPAGLIRPRVREVEELRNKIKKNWYLAPVKELANRIFWHRKLNLFCQFYVPSLTIAYMLHLPLPIKLIFLTSSTKSAFIALQLILTHIYRSSISYHSHIRLNTSSNRTFREELSSEMISRLLLVVLAFSALASSSEVFVQKEYPCFIMRFDCIKDCIKNGRGNPDFREGRCRKVFFFFFNRKSKILILWFKVEIHHDLNATYGSDNPGRGKWAKCAITFFKAFLWPNGFNHSSFSNVLKRFCPLEFKDTFVLVLAIFYFVICTALPPIGDFWQFLRLELKTSCN